MQVPGERLRGGSSVLHSREQEADNNALASTTGKVKEETKNEIEKEGVKRKATDTDVVLHWGQRKRSRCNRVDLKHITDESSALSKKAIRVDRRVVKAEKETVVDSKGQLLKKQSLWEAASEAARRNSNGSATHSSCPQQHQQQQQQHHQNQHHHHASPSPEKQPPSPDKHDRTAGSPVDCRPPFPNLDSDIFQWPRFLLSLSRKEKEDDFMTIKGTKLPQRPKRRPKVVEKALHYCSPGSWLGDLTRGRYDVREKKSVKKKPRGLKAMESMDSDSD